MTEDFSSTLSLSSIVSTDEASNGVLNFKETELRLGLPGSESPERNSKNGFMNLKDFSSGFDVDFSKTVDDSENWRFCASSTHEASTLEKLPPSTSRLQLKETQTPARSKDVFALHAYIDRARMVGWPPIRSFRKNTLASSSAIMEDDQGKSGLKCPYVKVSMDGAPYLRKVNLRSYHNFDELFATLKKMFDPLTSGQCCSNGVSGHLVNLLHVLTYEDKDGDWMLVGDVLWEMFTDSCKKLRIMKGAEATGLGI
ncbi:AUX/IAA domain [Dillenia turbinata]|uniref:Auxin-responsive protein n=1 Tax=Dillenia turbinata TaxID=194707 RepID=A0AAN8U982_9MAGN